MLLDAIAGCDALAAYVTAAIGESAAEDAEPFIGWVARAIGCLADVASMIETSVEVARSPATMALSIVRTMDMHITVAPDPRHQDQWPATATHYVITITYDDGPAYTYDGQMNPKTQQGPISHTFANLPAGGSLTVLACFYSDNHWLAGQGKTGSMDARPNQGSTLVVVPFEIKENLVPLSASTTYNFREKLGYTGGARVWLPASSGTPTATVSSLDSSPRPVGRSEDADHLRQHQAALRGDRPQLVLPRPDRGHDHRAAHRSRRAERPGGRACPAVLSRATTSTTPISPRPRSTVPTSPAPAFWKSPYSTARA